MIQNVLNEGQKALLKQPDIFHFYCRDRPYGTTCTCPTRIDIEVIGKLFIQETFLFTLQCK